MAKATYRGPGDAVELDGLRIERGKPAELTNGQIVRIRATDPYALVEVDPKSTAEETPRELARIRGVQDELRDDAADDRDREERETVVETDKAERAVTERSAKRAAERDKVRADAVRDRAELRATPAKPAARKEAS